MRMSGGWGRNTWNPRQDPESTKGLRYRTEGARRVDEAGIEMCFKFLHVYREPTVKFHIQQHAVTVRPRFRVKLKLGHWVR